MSRQRMLTLLIGLGALGFVRPATAAVTAERAERIALDAVRRACGAATAVTERDIDPRGWALTVDGRWWVGIVPETGAVRTMADREFAASEHAAHELGEPPTSEQIAAAGCRLIQKVFPGLDMSDFMLRSAQPRPECARVEAWWLRTIPENGFRGPGSCHVDFCWPDRRIYEIGAEAPPIPAEWRKKEEVTRERAEAIARRALGDLGGGWLQTTKAWCIVDRADRSKSRPAWNVLLRRGPEGNEHQSYRDRSVFICPWTGEVLATRGWTATGGPARSSSTPTAATLPLVTTGEADGIEPRPWLPWAGGAAAAVVLALGATMVCLRRRRG